MKKKGRGRQTLAVLSAAVAGGVNGLLGTGGGMILVISLSRLYPEEREGVMAISTACVFIFSLLTIILYKISGKMQGIDLLATLFPSLLGGVVGALLLGKLPGRAVEGIFALLLIFAGGRLLF